jgi:PhnB protein
MPVKPIPDGFHAITPFLVVDDMKAQIAYLESAFAGKLDMHLPGPGGAIMYAEVTAFGSKIMLGPSGPGYPARHTMLYLYVDDVDAVVANAVSAGGKLQGQVMDMFYGDRVGYVIDPQQNFWCIATHKHDYTPEQIQENMAKMFQK